MRSHALRPPLGEPLMISWDYSLDNMKGHCVQAGVARATDHDVIQRCQGRVAAKHSVVGMSALQLKAYIQ